MIETLIGKMDKLNTKMISKHDVLSCKGNKVKKSTTRAYSPQNESIVENFDDDKDDIVNHGRKSCIHQNSLYETWPRREFGGRFWPNRDFSQGRNSDDHDGLYCNLGSIKLKIPAFQGNNDPEAYLDWENKVEFIFDFHRYLEEKKVKLVVLNSLVILLFGGIK